MNLARLGVFSLLGAKLLSGTSEDRGREMDLAHWPRYEEKIKKAVGLLGEARIEKSADRSLKLLQMALEELQGGDGTIDMFINSSRLRSQWKTSSDTLKMIIKLDIGVQRHLRSKN
jgi:hypothetical protein